MNTVVNFKIDINKCKLIWNFGGKEHEKQFSLAINSAIELSDKSGFAVVGSLEEFGKSNAMLFNADGSLRAQLKIPENVKNAICFHEIYYVSNELTCIIASDYCDYACIIDETTGDCSKLHETR